MTDEETAFYQGIGREFIRLIETTNMTKVYKMPVLMAFYNHGNVRMRVTEEELLESWKAFFGTGTNWKDLELEMSYARFQKITDKEHLRKILQMPVHFLQESGKGMFVKGEDTPIALREELRDVTSGKVFSEQMKDVIEYRTMDYYQRRYRENASKERTLYGSK